jgi:hypothetical protein
VLCLLLLPCRWWRGLLPLLRWHHLGHMRAWVLLLRLRQDPWLPLLLVVVGLRAVLWLLLLPLRLLHHSTMEPCMQRDAGPQVGKHLHQRRATHVTLRQPIV